MVRHLDEVAQKVIRVGAGNVELPLHVRLRDKFWRYFI